MVASLAAIVVFRFVLKVGALETAAWVAFAFLQVCLLSQCCACSMSVPIESGCILPLIDESCTMRPQAFIATIQPIVMHSCALLQSECACSAKQ